MRPPFKRPVATGVAQGEQTPPPDHILDPEVRETHRRQNDMQTFALLGGIALLLAVPALTLTLPHLLAR